MSKTKEIIAYIQQNGFKKTPQRNIIAKYVAEEKTAITARILWEKIKTQRSDISLDTIYRNLNMFCELGILCKTKSLGKGSEFELINGRHIHYMICTHCGKKLPFENCVFNQTFINEKTNKEFIITDHKLELYGFCSKCYQERK